MKKYNLYARTVEISCTEFTVGRSRATLPKRRRTSSANLNSLDQAFLLGVYVFIFRKGVSCSPFDIAKI